MFGAKIDTDIAFNDLQRHGQDYVNEALRVWDSMHGTLPNFQTFMQVYLQIKQRMWLDNIRWN